MNVPLAFLKMWLDGKNRLVKFRIWQPNDGEGVTQIIIALFPTKFNSILKTRIHVVFEKKLFLNIYMVELKCNFVTNT